MAKDVLIVSTATEELSELLRPLVTKTRPLIRGRVGGYFGEARVRVELALGGLSPAFVVVGLTPCSQIPGSDGYEIEQHVIAYAVEHDVPVGIVCDTQGRITAAHLKGRVLDLVRFVVTNRPNIGCSPADMYPNANTFIFSENADVLADEIARDIARLLHVALPRSESPISRHKQLAASNASGSTNQYTD